MTKKYEYFITFGGKHKMYTLRRDWGWATPFVKNLSTKPDLAIKKAIDYIADYECWDNTKIEKKLDISRTRIPLSKIKTYPKGENNET